jgi:hypothetical protein
MSSQAVSQLIITMGKHLTKAQKDQRKAARAAKADKRAVEKLASDARLDTLHDHGLCDWDGTVNNVFEESESEDSDFGEDLFEDDVESDLDSDAEEFAELMPGERLQVVQHEVLSELSGLNSFANIRTAAGELDEKGWRKAEEGLGVHTGHSDRWQRELRQRAREKEVRDAVTRKTYVSAFLSSDYCLTI